MSNKLIENLISGCGWVACVAGLRILNTFLLSHAREGVEKGLRMLQVATAATTNSYRKIDS